MSDQQKPVKEARPGKGAAGNQWAVQMAQTTEVNPPDEAIPSNTPVSESVEQVKAMEKQEEGHGMKTTDGYKLDDSGQLNNFAVTPPIYTDEDE